MRVYVGSRVRARDLSLYDVLAALASGGEQCPYFDFGNDIELRIEELCIAVDGAGVTRIEGDIVRRQRYNLPPNSPDDGELKPNTIPVAHCCAFIVFANSDVLALETKKSGPSAVRLNGLIKRLKHGHEGFLFNPALTKNALIALRKGEVRNVEFGIASPTELAHVEDAEADMDESLRTLATLFGGDKINASIGFGRGNRRSRLSKDGVMQFLRLADRNKSQFKKMKIKLEGASEPIDYFAEQMKFSKTVNLDNGDTSRSYQQRRAFLEEGIAQHIQEIRDLYFEDLLIDDD